MRGLSADLAGSQAGDRRDLSVVGRRDGLDVLRCL